MCKCHSEEEEKNMADIDEGDILDGSLQGKHLYLPITVPSTLLTIVPIIRSLDQNFKIETN